MNLQTFVALSLILGGLVALASLYIAYLRYRSDRVVEAMPKALAPAKEIISGLPLRVRMHLVRAFPGHVGLVLDLLGGDPKDERHDAVAHRIAALAVRAYATEWLRGGEVVRARRLGYILLNRVRVDLQRQVTLQTMAELRRHGIVHDAMLRALTQR